MKVVIFLTVLGLGSAQVVPEPRNNCNQDFVFSSVGQAVHLQSPGWPNEYRANANCRYQLTSPQNTLIDFDCTEMHIEYSPTCAYDKMTVFLSGYESLETGTEVCGHGTFRRTTTSNRLVVRFKTDGANPRSSSLYRFNCKVTVVRNPAAAQAQAPAPAPAPSTGSSSAFSNPSCSCGTRNEATRIVGGTTAGLNEFPWRVGLHADGLGVFCGGSIISPNWVLTAAHCISPANGRQITIIIEGHDLTQQLRGIRCKRIIQHGSYNDQTQDNDIALCELEVPLTYSRTIQPVCLPWNMLQETFQGRTVTASGWGTTSHGGRAATTLRKVDLPVMTTSECRRYYGSSVTDNMICTYSAGKDTCQGDSGGSIDYRDPATGRYFGIGVVSWGQGCAGVNQPGVYAKMTNYLSWIQTVTGESFCR